VPTYYLAVNFGHEMVRLFMSNHSCVFLPGILFVC